MARPSLTRAHRVLLGLVAVGACLISGIGFAGSYSAVRELAVHKGFGVFSYAFPVGVDAGIVVLLALDLVLTWLRIPFPLLRQAAWLLTVATIAFNAAASWGDALGMGMHAVIPVLFVVIVEASRHAVGRIAAITADRHMESVRLMRWLLSPVPTFRLWRRMKLWELRSYDEVVRLEQNRLVYRAQLRFRYGRGWRRSAPIQALLPLKLAKYGVPLDVTALDRIDPPPVQQSPAPRVAAEPQAEAEPPAVSAAAVVPILGKLAASRWRDTQGPAESAEQQPVKVGRPVTAVRDIRATMPSEQAQPVHQSQPAEPSEPARQSAWFAPRAQSEAPAAAAPAPAPAAVQPPAPARVPAPVAEPAPDQADPTDQQGRQQPSGAQLVALYEQGRLPIPEPTAPTDPEPAPEAAATPAPAPAAVPAPSPAQLPRPQSDNMFAPRTQPAPEAVVEPPVSGTELTVDLGVEALTAYQDTFGHDPDEERLAHYLFTQYGVESARRPGTPPSRSEMARIWPYLLDRYATLGRD
ncbi:DUF2637 domain-containing protein [Kitasatospora azatica]|uniref:DUF2637 domain-containing protein n=1 Tax=Kitasatospora azatica TaxID=58347 RepID=UPI0012F7AC39|nr:DUF2637 domain-containing protein [Kitasatospora azatica]